MLNNKRIIAFTIYAVCLLALPAKMIYDQQNVFNEGTAYKFKCQPVDPNDPFRGKYVQLRFENIVVTDKEVMSHDKFFGVVTVDNEGYARIEKVVNQYSDNLILLELDYPLFQNDSTATFTFPIDRLYMNENKAQSAEDLYRNALRDNSQDVYAKIYISQGRYLLDDVYVDGVRLKDVLE